MNIVIKGVKNPGPTTSKVKCPECGQEVYRSASGILAHTRALQDRINSRGRATPDCTVCPGSTKGARP